MDKKQTSKQKRLSPQAAVPHSCAVVELSATVQDLQYSLEQHKALPIIKLTKVTLQIRLLLTADAALQWPSSTHCCS